MKMIIELGGEEIPDLIAMLFGPHLQKGDDALSLVEELRDDHTQLAEKVAIVETLASRLTGDHERQLAELGTHLRAVPEAVSTALIDQLYPLAARVAAIEHGQEVCGTDLSGGSGDPVPCTIRRRDYASPCGVPGCRFQEEQEAAAPLEPTLYRQYQPPDWAAGTDYEVGDLVRSPSGSGLVMTCVLEHRSHNWEHSQSWRTAFAYEIPGALPPNGGVHYWRPDVVYRAVFEVDYGGVYYESAVEIPAGIAPGPGISGWRRKDAVMRPLQPHHLPDDHPWAVAHLYARGCVVWHEGHQYRATSQTSTEPSPDAPDWYRLTDPEAP